MQTHFAGFRATGDREPLCELGGCRLPLLTDARSGTDRRGLPLLSVADLRRGYPAADGLAELGHRTE